MLIQIKRLCVNRLQNILGALLGGFGRSFLSVGVLGHALACPIF
jgi:hypothetical protein